MPEKYYIFNNPIGPYSKVVLSVHMSGTAENVEPVVEIAKRFVEALKAEGIKGEGSSNPCITMEEWGLQGGQASFVIRQIP